MHRAIGKRRFLSQSSYDLIKKEKWAENKHNQLFQPYIKSSSKVFEAEILA
jgi:hypothetical protein